MPRVQAVKGDDLDLSGGNLDSAAAFTYAPDMPEGQGFWDYLDNPESWIPERREAHAQLVNEAVSEAERFGDKVRIEMNDADGHSIFGAIEQTVVRYER